LWIQFHCITDQNNIKIVIEEYKAPTKNNGKVVKNDNKFFLPPIPWKWTLYDGFKVVGFGYTFTEEDANLVANRTLNTYKTKKPQYS
jgi:hypothetical protein